MVVDSGLIHALFSCVFGRLGEHPPFEKTEQGHRRSMGRVCSRVHHASLVAGLVYGRGDPPSRVEIGLADSQVGSSQPDARRRPRAPPSGRRLAQGMAGYSPRPETMADSAKVTRGDTTACSPWSTSLPRGCQAAGRETEFSSQDSASAEVAARKYSPRLCASALSRDPCHVEVGCPPDLRTPPTASPRASPPGAPHRTEPFAGFGLVDRRAAPLPPGLPRYGKADARAYGDDGAEVGPDGGLPTAVAEEQVEMCEAHGVTSGPQLDTRFRQYVPGTPEHRARESAFWHLPVHLGDRVVGWVAGRGPGDGTRMYQDTVAVAYYPKEPFQVYLIIDDSALPLLEQGTIPVPVLKKAVKIIVDTAPSGGGTFAPRARGHWSQIVALPHETPMPIELFQKIAPDLSHTCRMVLAWNIAAGLPTEDRRQRLEALGLYPWNLADHTLEVDDDPLGANETSGPPIGEVVKMWLRCMYTRVATQNVQIRYIGTGPTAAWHLATPHTSSMASLST